MKASIILAHPYKKSFNHAIFSTIINELKKYNLKTFAHDLYLEQFNPILTENELGTDTSNDLLVKRYAHELIESDLLFFIHPNWWGQPPAILKGYIDRVIRPPYAYDFPDVNNTGGLPIAKLNGKYDIVYNTSNTSKERENNYFGDPLDNIWKKCIFEFCGIRMHHRRMFRIIADSTMEQRLNWLELIKDDIKKLLTK